jgi:hypothetical protein
VVPVRPATSGLPTHPAPESPPNASLPQRAPHDYGLRSSSHSFAAIRSHCGEVVRNPGRPTESRDGMTGIFPQRDVSATVKTLALPRDDLRSGQHARALPRRDRCTDELERSRSSQPTACSSLLLAGTPPRSPPRLWREGLPVYATPTLRVLRDTHGGGSECQGRSKVHPVAPIENAPPGGFAGRSRSEGA